MSTYIPYDKLQSAGKRLKDIKGQLDKLKIATNGKNFKKLDIVKKIPDFEDAKAACKRKVGNITYIVTPDIKWITGDANYDFVCSEEETQQTKEMFNCWSMPDITEKTKRKVTYNIPSVKRLGKAMGTPRYLLEDNKDNIEKIRSFIKQGVIEYNNLVKFAAKFNQKIENLKDALEVECGNISKIYNAYNDLEKSAKKQFADKNGSKYSKSQIAKKYSALVAAAGSKNAKKYLERILKKTNSKVSKSTVLSIYDKWKNRKGKPENDDPVKKKPPGGPPPPGDELDKNSLKKASSKNVLVGVSALAATRKEINTEIKEVKSESKTQIANERITAADEKRKLEIAKNERIAEINNKAAKEIEAVNINDENAQKRIDEIKARAEHEVDAVNNQYKEDVARIDEDLQNKIHAIEENRDTSIANLNNQASKLKSNKSAGIVSGQNVVGNTMKGTAAAVVTTSNSDVAASNEEMMNATGSLSDAYEGKTAAISETLNNPATNNPSTSNPVTDSTINNNPNASVTIEESVASPVSPSTETVVEEPKNTSYAAPSANNNANDSYVTNDGPREDTIRESTATPTESTKDTGIDQSNSTSNTRSDLENNSSSSLKEKEEDIVSITGGDTEPSSKKSSSGLSTAIPVGLGVAATGAAAVAGIRYVKNRKQNEDMDESYDDENNNLEDENEYEEIPSDSAYMRDDYLGPEGSNYTEIPDENSYTDTEELEEAAGMSGFSEDTALSDLS